MSSTNTAGLRGQIAGQTALCTVGKTGTGLTYCGYDISDLAANVQFEEVAYLLKNGELPNAQQLQEFHYNLKNNRELPDSIKQVLELLPKECHPMDVMRTGCSILGNIETEADFSKQDQCIDRMLALFPAIICYWYRFSHHGVRIETTSDEDSIGAHFLHLLHGTAPSELHSQVMHASLNLYAEHEFNASTFTARVCASTLSDIHSCITAAIGTLRGPLHGGANEAAMDMISSFKDPDHAEQEIMRMLSEKQLIMGFGHAVYRKSDPRNAIIKEWSKRLSENADDPQLFNISERCEAVMWREKKLFCNADFFHASAYNFMNIPTKLFTPIFVISRVSGWTAHVKEQRAGNRIIRPNAEYIGPAERKVVPLQERN